MKEIVILDLGYNAYDFERELFESHGYTVKFYKGSAELKEKIKYCTHAVGVLVRGTPVNEQLFAQSPQLKAVVRYGVGYDNVNLKEASRYGIKVANVQGYATHSVSDHALALMYACIRNLPAASDHLQHAFGTPPVADIFELHDKTLGIIGLGRIGSALAQKTRGLFKEVLACDPYVPTEKFRELGVKKSIYEEIFSQSHVISLHCNLTDETAYLIDQYAFEKMVQKPVLINTARGAVVNTKALLAALKKYQIHSAGLDVFEDEPNMAYRNELLQHPLVQCTGHYAWYSAAAARQLQQRAAKNMVALLNGQTIQDLLNP